MPAQIQDAVEPSMAHDANPTFIGADERSVFRQLPAEVDWSPRSVTCWRQLFGAHSDADMIWPCIGILSLRTQT